MNRIAITVGVGSDWANVPLPHDLVQESLRKARDHLASHFGGYTEELVHGGWRRAGRTVEEPGRRFIVVADLDAFHADELARLIGRLFHQQAVMIEVEPLIDGSGVVPVW